MKGFSTLTKPDGSFEFAAVPPGRYIAELKAVAGTGALQVVRATVEAGSEVTKLELFSAPGQTSAVPTVEIRRGP